MESVKVDRLIEVVAKYLYRVQLANIGILAPNEDELKGWADCYRGSCIDMPGNPSNITRINLFRPQVDYLVADIIEALEDDNANKSRRKEVQSRREKHSKTEADIDAENAAQQVLPFDQGPLQE